MAENQAPEVDKAASAPEGGVTVTPAAFEDLAPPDAAAVPPRSEGAGNLDLILDVDVRVTACIGSVRKSIGEILSLTEGQVIDMERSAGEPVDLLVNGKHVARGEVVVVDERYGIRITEIVAPAERGKK
jgi:flagellar motor switch protein FliN/FliY